MQDSKSELLNKAGNKKPSLEQHHEPTQSLHAPDFPSLQPVELNHKAKDEHLSAQAVRESIEYDISHHLPIGHNIPHPLAGHANSGSSEMPETVIEYDNTQVIAHADVVSFVNENISLPVMPKPTTPHDGGKGEHGHTPTPITPKPTPSHDSGKGEHGDTPTPIIPKPTPPHDGGKGEHGDTPTPITPKPLPPHDGSKGEHGHTPTPIIPKPTSPHDGGKGEHGHTPPPVIDHTVVGHISLNSIGKDDVLNEKESQSSVVISGVVSGDVKAGDVVQIAVDHEIKQYSAKVIETVIDGHQALTFSTSVSGDILADAKNHEISASIVAENQQGVMKTITDDITYNVHTHMETQIHLNPMTSNDTLTLTESQHKVMVTGEVLGEVKVGDVITIDIDGHDISTAMGKDHDFSVAVDGGWLWNADKSEISSSVIAHDDYGNQMTAHTAHDLTYSKSANMTFVMDNMADMSKSLINLSDFHHFSGHEGIGSWFDHHEGWNQAHQNYQVWLNPLEWMRTEQGTLIDGGFSGSLVGRWVSVTKTELQDGLTMYHPSAGSSWWGKVYDHVFDHEHVYIRAGDELDHSQYQALPLTNQSYSWNENTQQQVTNTLDKFLSNAKFDHTEMHLNLVSADHNGKSLTEQIIVHNDGAVSLDVGGHDYYESSLNNALHDAISGSHGISGIQAVPDADIKNVITHAESLPDHNVYIFTNTVSHDGTVVDHGKNITSITLDPYYSATPSTSNSAESSNEMKHNIDSMLIPLAVLKQNSPHHNTSILENHSVHFFGHEHSSFIENDHHDDLFVHDTLLPASTEGSESHPIVPIAMDHASSDILSTDDDPHSLDHLLGNIPHDSISEKLSSEHHSMVMNHNDSHHTPLMAFSDHNGFDMSHHDIMDQLFQHAQMMQHS